jgi:TetR/AcrR family transcriptional repressor of mexJK operon
VTASVARRPSGRPTTADAAALAEHILDIATRGFLSDGYAATSVEGVAARAGVAKRTLYARWHGKPALFRAVLERLMQRWLDSAEPQPDTTTSGLDSILLWIARRALAVALEADALALHRLVIAESGRFPELAEMVQQSAASTGTGRVAGLLAGEMEAGRLITMDPQVAAEQFLYLVLTGPQRRALGLGPMLDAAGLEAWARQAVALFLNGCHSR